MYPKITRETRLTYKQAMYDQYVMSGGSDECYRNGMWGHCGPDCTVYGCKPECFDSEEQGETNSSPIKEAPQCPIN